MVNQDILLTRIKEIGFGILDPKTIREMSVVKIVTPELYDKEGYPIDGGLMDTRLGVIDPNLICRTCGGKVKTCFGHFGHIELAKPVIHPLFADTIHILLQVTCRECHRLLIEEEKIKEIKKELDKIEDEYGINERLITIKSYIDKTKKVNKCPHCGAEQLQIRFEKPNNYYEKDRPLNPVEVRGRLEKISDSDLILLGINPDVARPEWFVLTVLPVPPVTIRPSITLETGERSEDDLTHKLGEIVRTNQRLFEHLNAGVPEVVIEDLWSLLQYHVTTYIINSLPQIPPARHRSGQLLKTLAERIKGKEGRIRLNLLGKRTNYSARAVISPDPKIKIDEVGVPESFAKILTVPEKVTKWNIEYLKKFVENGPEKYPGANYVVRPDGRKKKITQETKEQLLEELEPGYVVERHIIDGDIALFNRQPSLHRLSMMAHKIRVLPGRTLRLNPAVCPPYNADFDGDEMNLHIPQTEEARAEALMLLEVQNQIISPRYGLSIIGATQDAISGNYVLTKYLKIPRSEAIDLLYTIGATKEEIKRLPKKEFVTGKEIFSVLLPKDFDYIGKSKLAKTNPSDPDAKVVIKKGKLIQGVMDEENLGEGGGLLLRNLHKQYGSEFSIEFLGKVYNLGVETLTRYGFTVKLSDLELPEHVNKEVQEIIESAERKVEELIKKYKKGELESLPGRTREETLELFILQTLNKARNDAGEVVRNNIDQTTGTSIMSLSGARGNIINIAQMTAIVGQQAYRGQRINFGYKDRTLSCFKPKELSPEARGFIRNSFKSGMKPWEYFFMSLTGRDSLMDTALRTPKSGYLYRRLSSAMQDLKVEYDFSVRGVSNRIIQFLYGDDGIDVSKSEGGKINVKRIIEVELNLKD